MAGSAAWRQAPRSFSQHAPPPPRPQGACPPQAPAKAACMACVRVPRSRGPAACLPTLEQWRGMLGGLGGQQGAQGQELGKQLQGREEQGGEAVGVPREVLSPPRPRSEISFRCVWGWGAVGPGSSRYKRWGQGHAFLGAKDPCPGLGVGGRSGAQWGSPPEVCLCPIWFPGDQIQGDWGLPPPPAHMSAIMESQNTKTHSSEGRTRWCS